MKTITSLLTLVFVAHIAAQSSQDSWDSAFHPKAVKQRKEQRYQDWINSWIDRECTVVDVKNYWLITFMQPMPDTLSPMYYKVRDQNEALKTALAGSAYDFEAQDIADQINIIRLREKGRGSEAAVLEQTRQQRILAHRQEELQKKIIAHQQFLEAEIDHLRSEVAQAKAAADAAWVRAGSNY